MVTGVRRGLAYTRPENEWPGAIGGKTRDPSGKPSCRVTGLPSARLLPCTNRVTIASQSFAFARFLFASSSIGIHRRRHSGYLFARS